MGAMLDRMLARGSRMGKIALLAAAMLYRIGGRTLSDGFIHAGNLAYLSLVTLFPAVILVHAVMAGFGRTEAGQNAIGQFLRTLPGDVADFIAPVLDEVVQARSGTALLVGALIALWTTSGFIGTLSDMLRRAHETPPERPFWQERLIAIAVTLGAIAVVIFAFAGRLVVDALVGTLAPYVPWLATAARILNISGLTGMGAVFLSIWALFRVLTPRLVRIGPAPIWPGALLVTVVWAGAALLFGPMMSDAVNFSLTYGAFTGVMLAMLFFYIVGFAFVAGVETNAALASRRQVVEMVGQWRFQWRKRRRRTAGDEHGG